MNRSKLLKSVVLAFAAALSAAAAADVPRSSFEGAGRNVMRTPEGGLVATFVRDRQGTPSLVFSASVDNGKTWQESHVSTLGHVQESAIDSNFQGSYVAFVDGLSSNAVGRIAYTEAPFAAQPRIVVSPPVTPANVVPRDTFIQASRKGWSEKDDQFRETVVYGWQDTTSKSLYVGVSLDGRNFPVAREIVKDPQAVSGPAVAVRGKHVVVTYLTLDPSIGPVDIPQHQREGRAYQAWVESWDGGITWSQPGPLYGSRSSDYPTIDVEFRGEDGNLRTNTVRLAGGTRMGNWNSLSWTATDNRTGEEINFVQSALSSLDEKGKDLGEVGVVSFRSSRMPWEHAVANTRLTNDPRAIRQDVSMHNAARSQFQYSALIDTPVRATTYKEHDEANALARLVVTASTDTGKTFSHRISYTPQQLAKFGLPAFDRSSVIEASQCLFEDRDGRVYVDLFVHQNQRLSYVRVPVGVNAAELRSAERGQKVKTSSL